MKGQASVEFAIIGLALFLIFLSVLLAASSYSLRLLFEERSLRAQNLADDIASAVNGVYLAGDGATATYWFAIRGDFNVSIQGNDVFVEWAGGMVDASLLTRDVVSGSTDFSQPVTLSNSRGVVSLAN